VSQGKRVGGASEAYDGLGWRETNSSGQNFQYDGSTMIGWSETGASYNFTTLPGGGALAGSFTANDTTTTWVPLIDTSGSTIGLVNAANVDSGPVTTYTYDPSGNPTVSGTVNDWPFQYQGMEKEVTDPGTYYYTGSGQFYSPQLVRSLSEVGQTGTQGAGGPSGNSIAAPSSGSGGVPTAVTDAGIADAANNAATLGTYAVLELLGEAKLAAALLPLGPVPVIVATAALILFDILDEIFGGGSSAPPTPRQLLHGRHPLYPLILGVQDGLIPTMESAGKPEFCGDPAPCPNARPLHKQPKLSCQQQYIVDMADCSKSAEAKVGLLGGAAELACGIGAYFTDGADLLVCGGRVATMTATASVSVLAKCQIAAQAKEFKCIESQTEP
jgi:hypothetical protein